MSNSTNIVNLNDKRPEPVPPLPQHWIERINNPESLSEQEMEMFAHEAGPHLEAWITAIEKDAGRSKQEAALLRWESRILEHLGYYDEEGNPRPELRDRFFDEGGQLRPELWEQHQDLRPVA